MENIIKKIEQTFKDKKLYIFAIITIAFFGIFSKVQYAPDTYSVFTNPVDVSVAHFFSCGRYVTGLATSIFMGTLNLSNTAIYFLSYGFAILFMIISLYKLDKIVGKYVKNEMVSIIITTVTLINPFSIELYFYIEKGIMVFSVLLCVLAVEQMDKFFQGKKISILWALLSMLIANCCYQGTVGTFVALSLILILEYSKNIKDFIKNNILVALAYGIPAVVNFLSIKILSTNVRISGSLNLAETIKKVIEGSKSMLIGTYTILPKYLFLGIITFLILFIVYKIIRKKETKIKTKILILAGVFYLIAGTYIATVAPQMIQATNSIWFVPRSSYPMGVIIGILMLYAWKNFEIKNIEKNIMIIIATIYALIQLTSFVNWGIDNYIGNYEDKRVSEQIIKQIEKYEKETGNVIDSVAIYQDKSPQYAYIGIKAIGDMNIRAYFPDWCITRILTLYTQREWKKVDIDEGIKETFLTQNWDDFSEKQIKFEKNIMHLCIY